jgi:hypothetical protein
MPRPNLSVACLGSWSAFLLVERSTGRTGAATGLVTNGPCLPVHIHRNHCVPNVPPTIQAGAVFESLL